MVKVLITRPRGQAAELGAALAAAGFDPIFFPVIEIRPMADLTELDRALQKIASYDWVVFTSVNGVEVVLDRLEHASKGAANGVAAFPKTAAIGPKTAQALRKRGINPVFVPEEYMAEALLPGLGDLCGKMVLLPRAEIARKALPEGILAAGGAVHEIPVYDTHLSAIDVNGLAAIQSGVDIVTFTSPSTVHNYVQILHEQGLNPHHLPGNPRTACIGPITAQAARAEGFQVDTVAQEYTAEGLVQAVTGLMMK